MIRHGKVVAICTSGKGGLPKYPMKEGRVGQFGLMDDHHNRELRPSFSKRGTFKPNTDRHITIVALEVIKALNEELHLTLIPGSLGENITVEGFGDLSDLREDNEFWFERGPVFRVVEQNMPCKNLAPIHPLLVKKIYGRRGVLCAITRGFWCDIRPDETIKLWSV